jgi:hypothetical protein
VKIICLTPVKNEEWILERFLLCASLWADHIIIADQNSTDSSRDIAESFDKVIVVENNSKAFNEPERQKILINAARKISGPKLLIALDADEFLSSNYLDSFEWKHIQSLEPGSRVYFEFINIHSSYRKYWTKGHHYFGFIDNGSPHVGFEIDSPRLPDTKYSTIYKSSDIKVLHFQYTDPQRVKYKQIWYQCLEKTLSDTTYLGGRKTNYYIFQRYNKYKFPARELKSLQPNWTDRYIQEGILLFKAKNCSIFFLKYIRILFDKYGVDFFEKLDIWEESWNDLFGSTIYHDPRTYSTKLIHKWLNNRKHLHFKSFELFLIRCLELVKLF